MLDTLTWAYGKPLSQADFKSQLADFKVVEQLGFTPSGQGEHLFVELEKQGENTQWASSQLAKALGVSPQAVSYAGLKDRYGMTRQWFSIQYPLHQSPRFRQLPSSLRVLQVERHHRKLRRGALQGNHFVIHLRELSNIDDAIERVQMITQQGVPNYFGPQRFGHQGQNLQKAEQLFAGKRVKDRQKRGLYLSAARSMLFNQVVSARLKSQLAHHILEGDCLMLAGSHSFFTVETVDESLCSRLAARDILLSAPLVGEGELASRAQAAQFEIAQLEPYSKWCKGLAKARLKQDRRPLWLYPSQLKWQQEGTDLVLEFFLPAGSYATSLLRELVHYDEGKESA